MPIDLSRQQVHAVNERPEQGREAGEDLGRVEPSGIDPQVIGGGEQPRVRADRLGQALRDFAADMEALRLQGWSLFPKR